MESSSLEPRPSFLPAGVGQAVRFAALCFFAGVTLGVVVSVVQIFGRGVFDPKWGGPASNFQLFMQLVLISVTFQALFVLAFSLLPMVRRARLRGRPETAAAVLFAVVSLVWFPPGTSQPFLVAAVIALSSVLVAVIIARSAKVRA